MLTPFGITERFSKSSFADEPDRQWRTLFTTAIKMASPYINTGALKRK
jgi:hypothetical protein